MPTLPLNVQPGDIISSELMTLILTRLSELSDVVITGTHAVPDVIGTQLYAAKKAIEQPSRQLSLGFVIDITGAAIDPNDGKNATLIVLNQSPPAGSLVKVNSPVNLIVSGTAGSTPDTGQQPAITSTQTVGGASATDFAVGDSMVIVGSNFRANPAQNIVTFDDIQATISSDPAAPTQRLLVTVPAGIPGAPANPGDATKSNVTLKVQDALSKLFATTTVNITAPIPGQPTISAVSPSIQYEGLNITISGTNFTGDTTVTIKDVQASIVSFTSTKIVATVPQYQDIVSGPPIPGSLVVTVPDVGSATYSQSFYIQGA